MFWRVIRIWRTSQPLRSMLKINVALPNGHAELLTLLPSSTLQELKTAAQQAFGKMHLRLITAKNRVLVNFEQTLEEAEIEDGECLTALELQPQPAATKIAFALWCHGDSRIVTWGNAGWAVIVRQFKISSGVCSRFKPQVRPLLRFSSSMKWGGVQCGLLSQMPLPVLQEVQAIFIDGLPIGGYEPSRTLGLLQQTERKDTIPSTTQIDLFLDKLPSGFLFFLSVDPSSPGAMQMQAVTVRQFKISSGVWCRFKPQVWPLLWFWQMDLSLPWVISAGSGGKSSAVQD